MAVPERSAFTEDPVASAASAARREDADGLLLRYTQTIDQQARLIAEQAAALAYKQKIFDRASEAARIGVWECTLPDNRLYWSEVVYDLFDMPRNSPLERERTLEFYSDTSIRELAHLRDRAIAERGGFSMDAAIVTAKGRKRWIRINAIVECEGDVPVRIFGMKQDITEAKTLLDKTRYLAECDPMTGLANRSVFQTSMAAATTAPSGTPTIGGLLIVDLDGFKQINDTLGHAAGDACLQTVAERLGQVCSRATLVARIGGDEFAVLIGDTSRALACDLARDIVDVLARPCQTAFGLARLSASVGVALVRRSAPSHLFIEADAALYAAKNSGRNTFRLYDGPEVAAPHPRGVPGSGPADTQREFSSSPYSATETACGPVAQQDRASDS